MKDTADALNDAKVDRHDAALVEIRRCFDARSDDTWLVSQHTFSRILTEEERVSLAYTMIRSLPAETAYQAAQTALDETSSWLPPLDQSNPRDVLDAAKLWADGASHDELKAAAMVSVQRMPEAARSGFVSWLKKKGWA